MINLLICVCLFCFVVVVVVVVFVFFVFFLLFFFGGGVCLFVPLFSDVLPPPPQCKSFF